MEKGSTGEIRLACYFQFGSCPNGLPGHFDCLTSFIGPFRSENCVSLFSEIEFVELLDLCVFIVFVKTGKLFGMIFFKDFFSLLPPLSKHTCIRLLEAVPERTDILFTFFPNLLSLSHFG